MRTLRIVANEPTVAPRFSSRAPSTGSYSSTFEETVKSAVEKAKEGNFADAAKLLTVARANGRHSGTMNVSEKITTAVQEIVSNGLATATDYAQGKLSLNESQGPAQEIVLGRMLGKHQMEDYLPLAAETYEIEAGSNGPTLISYLDGLEEFASDFEIEVDVEQMRAIHQMLVNRRLDILMEHVSGIKYGLLSTGEGFDRYLQDTWDYTEHTGCDFPEERIAELEIAAKKSWAIEYLFFAGFEGEWKDLLQSAKECAKEAGLGIEGRIEAIVMLRLNNAGRREWVEYYLAEATNPLDIIYAPLYARLAIECAIYVGEGTKRIKDRIRALVIVPYQDNGHENRLALFYRSYIEKDD